MRTIIVKDELDKIIHNEHINWKKVIPTAVFLVAMFFLGRVTAESMVQTREAAGQNAVAEQETGQTNAADRNAAGRTNVTDQVVTGQENGSGITAEQASDLLADAENWGLGFGGSGQKPTGNATVDEMKQYNAYYMAEGDEKVLYLTFDCGYENGNTEPILDALKAHNAPATFFVVGHMLESAPDIIKRMVADGHTVGNHTYHHPDMSKISDEASFRKEMDDVANLFREVTGTDMAMYYRPPQGKYSTSNLKMAKDMGYSTFFWSLAYVDWNIDAQPSHEEAMEKLMGRIHPGAIVLLHSTSKTNGEILDEVLTKWEEMGYTFRPLSDFVEDSENGGECGGESAGDQDGSENESGNSGGGRILQDESVPKT